MAYKIIYVDDARQDVKEAKRWYKKQLDGLQKRFASSIAKAISRLSVSPHVYAIRYKNIRIVHPDNFPFGVHFYIDEVAKQVVITAIIHDYRDVEVIESRNG